jgi:hypothetical protein
MKQRSAIKTDLFADQHHKQTLDKLGDPVSSQGGRPPFPTEAMVRILILKRLYNLCDEQMEYQLLDRMSYQRFCGLT